MGGPEAIGREDPFRVVFGMLIATAALRSSRKRNPRTNDRARLRGKPVSLERTSLAMPGLCRADGRRLLHDHDARTPQVLNEALGTIAAINSPASFFRLRPSNRSTNASASARLSAVAGVRWWGLSFMPAQ